MSVLSPARHDAPPLGPLAIALAGMISLSVAMGIGRFAFTPLLPMMLRDRVIDLPAASWLASANYLGYLAGALICTVQPWLWTRFSRLPRLQHGVLARAGLLATLLVTLAMALPWPAVWPLLRFLAGVASAVAFVFTSGYCLGRLARHGVPTLGAVIFAGPGAGIAASGLMVNAMSVAGWSSAAGWISFAVLGMALTACAWQAFRERDEEGEGRRQAGSPATPAAPTAPTTFSPAAAREPAARAAGAQMALLTIAYGLAGFGYIVTATFLPVIARESLPASPWLDMFWPVLGCGVIAGALLSSRFPMRIDRRYLLAGGYGMQAAGVGLSIAVPTIAGFALSSLLVGLPFTAITFFAMQEVRRLKPHAAASFMALVTAMYGIGQIVGPPMVAVLLRHSGAAGRAFTLSLMIACAALLTGAALYLAMIRLYPLRKETAGQGPA